MTDNSLLVQSWRLARQRMKVAQELERDLRERLVTNLFPDYTLGTNHDDSFNLKCIFAENYSLDSKKVDTMMSQLELIGVDIYNVFKFKPEIIKANYELLDAKAKVIVDTCLTIKPAAPQLKEKGEK